MVTPDTATAGFHFCANITSKVWTATIFALYDAFNNDNTDVDSAAVHSHNYDLTIVRNYRFVPKINTGHEVM
jgi:hypothetical protein